MRCIDVNIKLLEEIKIDLKEHFDSTNAATASHVTPSQLPKSPSGNVVQTSSPETCISDSHKHANTRTEGENLDQHDPLSLSSSPIDVDSTSSSETTRTTTALPSTTAMPSPTSTRADQQSNLSFVDTIKVEPDENYVEVPQIDPLELVSCSYANVIINELKPVVANALNDEPNGPSKRMPTENETESSKVFVKSEEIVEDNYSAATIGESSQKDVDKRCNDCRVTIKFCDRLKCHMCTICLKQRNGNSTYECSVCSKVFQSKHVLTQHLKCHSQMCKFKCGLCDSGFRSSRGLKHHSRLKHKKSRNLKTTLCKTGNQYESFNDSLINVNEMHSVFAGLGTSDDVDMNMPNSKSKPEIDSISDSLTTEIEIAKIPAPNYTCVVCNETFGERKALEKHVETHDKRPPAKEAKGVDRNLCSYCGKTFGSKKHLQQHVKLTHLSTRDHKCQLCDKSYKRSSVLRDHVESVHEKNKKYQCTLCGALLSSSNGLHSHTRMHRNRSKAPAVKCPVCPKLFKQKKDVDRHMRSHTGETPYRCSHCPREFTLQWNLIQHERLHTGEKRYKCDRCGKAFTHNVSRKNHMKCHVDDDKLDAL